MNDFVFSQRWSDVRARELSVEEHRSRLEAELHRELSVGHPLFGVRATALARCGHCDDTLFQLPDGTFAVVHLTWRGSPEPAPWPDADLHLTWATVLSYLHEHEEL